MARSKNIYGGGAQTNKNGLAFEQTTSLDNALIDAGYKITSDHHVLKGKNKIGLSVPKKYLYTYFLEINGIDYKDYNSKGWQPDEAFINLSNKTAYIIEKKYQNSSGSVDEKLPSCHFKKLEYEKLFTPLNFNVEFIYIFNDWFHQNMYRDTLDYIKMMGCHYVFNVLPLNMIGLK